MANSKSIYQISTLQALAMGYTRRVTDVQSFLQHGDIGLGTFENVDGEMIVLDGECFRATEDGTVFKASPDMGIPFACIASMVSERQKEIADILNIEQLKKELDLSIEDVFGLNSIHMVRIDGEFSKISARSESPYKSQHIELKDVLAKTQKEFILENTAGSLVCVYFPDYLDGINASGWHVHFVSSDHKRGGHVFDLSLKSGRMHLMKIDNIQMHIPSDPAFDTYTLKDASQKDIKEVEQGK